MRRRDFLAGIALTTTFRPAHAQQPNRVYRIGFLVGSSPAPYHDGLINGLRDLGYVEGKNIIVERRSSGPNTERLPQLARELVELGVEVIVAGGTPAIVAARDASDTTPIVMGTVGDPVAVGLVESLARPGGRITGVTNQNSDLGAKRLQVLKEIFPTTARVRVLSHSVDPLSSFLLNHDRAGARALAIELDVTDVRDGAEL